MRAFLVLLVMSVCAFAGPKRDRVDAMFDGDTPFSFDVLYGSKEAYEAVRAAGQLKAYRVGPYAGSAAPDVKTVQGLPILSGPTPIVGALKEQLHKLLLAEDTFGDRPLCLSEPGVVMRLTSGTTELDFIFCFKCHMVIIVADDEKDEVVLSMNGPSFGLFVNAFQNLFPDDLALKAVKLK